MSEQTNEPVPLPDHQSENFSRQGGQFDLTGSSARPLGMQQCPSCGAKNHANASVCLACGEQLRQRPKKIRCRQCGQQASSSLTICPNCGRELQAAPSRLWTWILPLGVVVLLAIFWFSRSGGPVSWAGDQADRVVVWVTGMGAEMDPQMTILTTPDADTPVLELVSAGTDDPDQVDTDGALLSDPGLADGEAASGETAVALLPTNTPLAEPPAPTEIDRLRLYRPRLRQRRPRQRQQRRRQPHQLTSRLRRRPQRRPQRRPRCRLLRPHCRPLRSLPRRQPSSRTLRRNRLPPNQIG